MTDSQPAPDGTLIATLQWQFRMSWHLARDFHVSRITDDVCSWLPDPGASTVRIDSDGAWHGDWIEPVDDEPWSVTVGWLLWHMQLWLTQAIAEVNQSSVPSHGDVLWPGNTASAVAELDRLVSDWTEVLRTITPDQLDRSTTFPWPDPRPLHRLLAWANMEMMKNAAELGVTTNAALLALNQSDRRGSARL